jgi:hypothetical protein
MTLIQDMTLALNRTRAGHGLPPVESNSALAGAAMLRAEYLARTGDLDHEEVDGQDGGTRARDAGYHWARWGEIIGWGWNGDVSMMVNWWMSSPLHRDYVLGNWEHFGVGMVYEPKTPWGYYWTVLYGNGGAAVPVDPPAPQPSLPYTSYAPIVTNGGGNGSLDLLPYFLGDGRVFEVRHPSGATETFQVQRQEPTFYLVKNSQWEQLAYDDYYIYRGLDTSPGSGRFYVQYDQGDDMARWCPRRMRPGETWTGAGHRVQFYDKTTGAPSAAGVARLSRKGKRH